jgi:hypothetical protein
LGRGFEPHPPHEQIRKVHSTRSFTDSTRAGEILNEVWGPLDRSEVLKPRAGLGVTADRADVAAAAAPFESAVRLKVMAVSPVSVML